MKPNGLLVSNFRAKKGFERGFFLPARSSSFEASSCSPDMPGLHSEAGTSAKPARHAVHQSYAGVAGRVAVSSWSGD